MLVCIPKITRYLVFKKHTIAYKIEIYSIKKYIEE